MWVSSQALTLLYIGGASSTSRLLSCQEVDGAGETRRVTILWTGRNDRRSIGCCNVAPLMRGRGETKLIKWSGSTRCVLMNFDQLWSSFPPIKHIATFPPSEVSWTNNCTSKERLPERFVFRTMMPYILCHEVPERTLWCAQCHHLYKNIIYIYYRLT